MAGPRLIAIILGKMLKTPCRLADDTRNCIYVIWQYIFPALEHALLDPLCSEKKKCALLNQIARFRPHNRTEHRTNVTREDKAYGNFTMSSMRLTHREKDEERVYDGDAKDFQNASECKRSDSERQE